MIIVITVHNTDMHILFKFSIKVSDVATVSFWIAAVISALLVYCIGRLLYQGFLLSRQLEWNSMKNFVLDLVQSVATQFMNLIPPLDALLGSEEQRRFKIQDFKIQKYAGKCKDHTI